MLPTDATEFSKKEGDAIGKWGGDLAKRHMQSTHKMAFHLRVLDTQEQTNEPHLTHTLRCWRSCNFYSSALEVLQMSTPLRDADNWTQFSDFSRMRRNSAFSSPLVPNQAANGGDTFHSFVMFSRIQTFLHNWVFLWHTNCSTKSTPQNFRIRRGSISFGI